MRPAKTQISLCIRPIWSESLLSAWRKLGSLDTHWAHSEYSDQTGRMSRLIWAFAGRTCHFVGFVTRRPIFCLSVSLFMFTVGTRGDYFYCINGNHRACIFPGNQPDALLDDRARPNPKLIIGPNTLLQPQFDGELQTAINDDRKDDKSINPEDTDEAQHPIPGHTHTAISNKIRSQNLRIREAFLLVSSRGCNASWGCILLHDPPFCFTAACVKVK